MLRNKMFALTLLALSTSAFATEVDFTGSANLDSELVYRGQSLSDDLTVGLDLQFNNLLLDGLFVEAQFDTLSLTPLSDSTHVRSDVGFGYANVYSDIQWEVSLNRVLNPVIYTDDYTEARVKATYSVFFAEAALGLTNDVNQDAYFAVGAEAEFWPNVTLGALVSAVNYDVVDNTEFNNFELFANYNVTDNWNVYGKHSFGGENQFGADFSDQTVVGVQYDF